MKIVALVLPFVTGSIAYFYIPLVIWIDMNQGLLAFLGLVSAAIIQVIPVTTNFIQSDPLTPAEAQALSRQLHRQQYYWIGLLGATIATFLILVLASILKERSVFHLANRDFDIAPLCSAVVTAALTFVFIKMGGIVKGVLSLQELRTQLVLDSARRRADERAKEMQRQAGLIEDIVPKDYGKIVK